jgi:hypothetical protein
MEFRRHWLNYILRQSSNLFYAKQRLLVAHGWSVPQRLLAVWLQEIILGLAGFPVFLFLKSSNVPEEHRAVYHLRRQVTLIVLVPLVVLWTLRLVFGMVVYIQGTLDEFARGPAQLAAAQTWQKISNSAIITRLLPPSISASSTAQSVFGSTENGSQIIVSLAEKIRPEVVLFFKADIVEGKKWQLPSTELKKIPSGTYQVAALSLDERSGMRSQFSQLVEVNFPKTWLDYGIQFSGYIVYITAGFLIILALLMSILNI